MGNQYFYFFINKDQNLSEEILYDLMIKLILDSNLDLGKCPNQKTHKCESACFLVRAPPEVLNGIGKQLSHKAQLKNFGKHFSLYKKKSKNIDFPLYSKSCREGFKGFFSS